MAKTYKYEAIRADYSRLWKEMDITPSRRADVTRSVNKIIANKARYQAVEKATRVPWWFIGLIHKMECDDLSFEQHLHNGDSLKARTWQVPKGRPLKGTPPFTWEESAIDALTMKGKEFHKVTDWSLEHVCYMLELFNGWGYRYRGVPTPYLWSFTNRYVQGKFESDGVYVPTLVSKQSGCMALLKVLMEKDSSVVVHATDIACVGCDETERAGYAKVQRLDQSRTLYGIAVAVYGLVGAFFSLLGDWTQNGVDLLLEAAAQSTNIISSISPLAEGMGIKLLYVTLGAVAIGLIIAATARVDAHKTGKVA